MCIRDRFEGFGKGLLAVACPVPDVEVVLEEYLRSVVGNVSGREETVSYTHLTLPTSDLV